MFERLGSLTYRLRYAIVLAWIAGAAWAVLFAPSLAAEGMTDQTAFLPPSAASVQARDSLEAAFPGSTSMSSASLAFSRDGGLTDADRAFIAETAAWITSADAPAGLRDAVAGVETAASRPELASLLRSADGELEMMNVNLNVVMAGSAGDAVVGALREHLATAPIGLASHVTGAAGIGSDYLAAIVAGTDSTTVVTVLLVVVILLLIYRAPLAAMIPLVTIGAAFVVARGALGVLALLGWKVSSLLDTFIVVLIFGVGTDYAIFLISRFREEVAKGDWHDASRATVGRIGAVISASAATVIVGLGAMAFGDFGMIQTTGPALAVGIFVTLVAGLTLAPALLAIFGHYLFWPRHTRTEPEGEPGGFFARLAAMVSHHPALVTGVLLVVLVIPALGVTQMRTNFDVLAELPASSDARAGFDVVAAHLGRGKVFQAAGIVDGGPDSDLLEPASLARLLAVMQGLAATPGVGSVTSVVTPEGDGKLPDGFRPSWQLAEMARGLKDGAAGETPADSAAILDPDVTDGLDTMATYLDSLAAAFPDVASATEFRAATAGVAKAQDQVAQAREGALVSSQLRTLADAMSSPAAAAGGSGESIGLVGDYLDELAAAYPEARSLPAFGTAQAAVASLEKKLSVAAAADLADALESLATHFDGRPEATLFPDSLAGTAEAKRLQREVQATFDRLQVDLGALGVIFAARPDDVFIPAGLGGEAGTKVDDAVAAFVSSGRSATRFYLSTADDPYSQEAFATIGRVQDALAAAAPGFGAGASAHLGGTTAQFSDVQATLASDFQRVGIITVLGILLVLMILLRAVVAPLYLVGTVLLSCATALGLSSWFFQSVLGQPGVSFYLPILVFVLLVAIGSDYNIFLMSRVREESQERPVRDGIRIASGRTGAVITSAGLILAGTFGSMATAQLAVLFQVGVTVALGVLIDTFLVRSILVPAITTLLGERAWWPSGWAAARSWWPVVVAIPARGAAGAGSHRRLAMALGVAAVIPLLVAGLLTWSLNDPAGNLRWRHCGGRRPRRGRLARRPGRDGPADRPRRRDPGAPDGEHGRWHVHVGRRGARRGPGGPGRRALRRRPHDPLGLLGVRCLGGARRRRCNARQAAPRDRRRHRLRPGNDCPLHRRGAGRRDREGRHGRRRRPHPARRRRGADRHGRDRPRPGPPRLPVDRPGRPGRGHVERCRRARGRARGAGRRHGRGRRRRRRPGDRRAAPRRRDRHPRRWRKAPGRGGRRRGRGRERCGEGGRQLAGGLDRPGLGRGRACRPRPTPWPRGPAGLPTAPRRSRPELARCRTAWATWRPRPRGPAARRRRSTTSPPPSMRVRRGSPRALASRPRPRQAWPRTRRTCRRRWRTTPPAWPPSRRAARRWAAPIRCARSSTPSRPRAAGWQAAPQACPAGRRGWRPEPRTSPRAPRTWRPAPTRCTRERASLLPRRRSWRPASASSAAGADALAGGARKVATGAEKVATGSAALAKGMPPLVDGLADAAGAARQLAGGADKMAGGMAALATGADELGAGARAAAAGASRLAAGTSTAADGASALAAGMNDAAEGARLVASGADNLASDGTAVADDAAGLAAGLEKGSAAIPAYPDRLREALDAVVADPVSLASTRQNPLASDGAWLAPLLAALALWIGALAAFLVLPAFLGRLDPQRWWRRALAGYGAAALLAIVQAVLLVLVLRLAVGIEIARLPELMAVAALAALTFVAVNQALVALFDYRGWLVSLVLLAVQVAAVGAMYPIATAPAFLQLLHLFLPMTFAVDAFRALIGGGGPSLAPAVVGLVVWLVGSVMVTLAVAYRSRDGDAGRDRGRGGLTARPGARRRLDPGRQARRMAERERRRVDRRRRRSGCVPGDPGREVSGGRRRGCRRIRPS